MTPANGVDYYAAGSHEGQQLVHKTSVYQSKDFFGGEMPGSNSVHEIDSQSGGGGGGPRQ